MFLGQPTIADLIDLIRAKQYDIDQVDSAMQEFVPTWQSTDPNASKDWLKDWSAFLARWVAALKPAMDAINGAKDKPVDPSVIIAKSQYNGILAALSQDPNNAGQTKGDFQDLNNRLQAAKGKPVDFHNQPQPTQTDVDSKIMTTTANIPFVKNPADMFKWAGIAAVGGAGLYLLGRIGR